MKKRFIAGAICPSCGEMDRLVMYEDQGVILIECVACAFRDSNRRDSQDKVEERDVKNDDVSPIKILS